MEPTSPARQAALDAMRAVSRGRRIDLAFADAVRSLEPRDRRWAHELLYGTVRLRGRLDHLLGRRLDRGLGSVANEVLDVLRLGAYQALYMGGVPEYAAVSQTVDQARALAGKGAAGLTNAVLRALVREGAGPELFPDADADPAGHLCSWGSHPRWLVERWLTRWGPEAVSRLVHANNEVPGYFVRPFGLGIEEAGERLGELGISASGDGGAGVCLRVTSDHRPAEVLGAIPAIVQDPGAALVSEYADVASDARVVDLCAAPGGKALALAQGASYVVAADISARRMALLRASAQRLGNGLGGRLGLVVADARRPAVRWADVVLVDAPCTGTGTFRRHPDARWRVDAERLRTLVSLQADVLEGASALVPEGGMLVYATCSLEVEENAGQVSTFLGRHPDFRIEPGPCVGGWSSNEDGCLELLPQHTGFDGAFVARLRRT